MKALKVLFASTALVMLTASLALAGTATPRVDQRQVNQRARIGQGVRSGEVTRGEAMRLRSGQRHVRRMERRFKRDGCVTRGERARLHRAQNVQSHRIWRMKHNGNVR